MRDGQRFGLGRATMFLGFRVNGMECDKGKADFGYCLKIKLRLSCTLELKNYGSRASLGLSFPR